MSWPRWWRAVTFGLGLGGGAALFSGCAVPLQAVCPGCSRLVVGLRPPVPPGTQTVFVLVPGLLGYGWEWNGAQIALAQLPGAAVLVHEWDPWTSVREGGTQLAASVQYLLRRLPGSVHRVVVLGHSAAGLLAVAAAAQLQVPPGLPVQVLVVGAPLAGNSLNVLSGADNFATPLPLAMAGTFTHWPEPAPGVQLQIWPTGTSDPVMQWRFGHDPGDPRVLPRAAQLRPLPPGLDHNVALGQVARQLVAELRAAEPPPLTAPVLATSATGVQPPAAATREPAAELTAPTRQTGASTVQN